MSNAEIKRAVQEHRYEDAQRAILDRLRPEFGGLGTRSTTSRSQPDALR